MVCQPAGGLSPMIPESNDYPRVDCSEHVRFSDPCTDALFSQQQSCISSISLPAPLILETNRIWRLRMLRLDLVLLPRCILLRGRRICSTLGPPAVTSSQHISSAPNRLRLCLTLSLSCSARSECLFDGLPFWLCLGRARGLCLCRLFVGVLS